MDYHSQPIQLCRVSEVVPMRTRWFYSLAACAACVGLAHAESTLTGTAPPDRDLSQFTPKPGDKANKIPEAAANRQLSSASDDRFSGAKLHAERNLTTPPGGRDQSLFTPKPGEKANTSPEAAANRQLTSESSGRTTLPPSAVRLGDRRTIDDR